MKRKKLRLVMVVSFKSEDEYGIAGLENIQLVLDILFKHFNDKEEERFNRVINTKSFQDCINRTFKFLVIERPTNEYIRTRLKAYTEKIDFIKV